MTGRFAAKFAPAFSRDLKKKAAKRNWNLVDLETVVDLILALNLAISATASAQSSWP